MNASQEYAAVRQMVADHWRLEGGAMRTDVLWANEAETPPVDPVDRAAAGYPARFIGVYLTHNSAELLTYDEDQVDGDLLVEFVVQAGCGEEKLRELFDAFHTMVNEHGDEAGLQFLPPVLGDGELSEDSTWYFRLGSFPFVRMEAR